MRAFGVMTRWLYLLFSAVLAHASELTTYSEDASTNEPSAEPDLVPTVTASVGGEQLLECQLDFPFKHHIPYHLQWNKDGEEVYSWYSGGAGSEAVEAVGSQWRGRVRRAGTEGDGGAIVLTGIRGSDAGLYRCRVVFPNRSPPARRPPTYWRLKVEGDDLITAPPVNITVLEGEHVELTCTPRHDTSTVEWSKDGNVLEEGRMANGSLVLMAAKAVDAGLYECVVKAPHGARQQAAAYLDVQYPAKVVHAPSERLLARGQPASLDCHFAANPPLTNLRWEKDGFLFDPYNVPGVFYSRNGSLLFNSVTEQHEGAYSCTPYNALGTAGPAPPVKVVVVRAPELAVRPQPLYVARLGGALSLPCEPRADKVPLDVHWRRVDGGVLPAQRHSLSGGNLTLAPLHASDAGGYTCTVSNAAGADSARTDVRIENVPPRAPTRLTARAEHTQIHLTWTPQPGPSSEDAQYEVWYRPRTSSEWRTLRVLTLASYSATILGLKPGVTYELRVLYTDHLGDGLFSRPLLVRTPSEEEGGVTEAMSAVTDSDDATTHDDDDTDDEVEAKDTDNLNVKLRLVEEGVLVRWARVDGAKAGQCHAALRSDGKIVAEIHTDQEYMLVTSVEEGAQLQARVRCGVLFSASTLHVPAYARLRAVALGCGGGALLLAAVAAAIFTLRARKR